MPSNEITAEQWDKLPSPSDFDQKAKKFRDERNNAWDEFLDISAQAGYNIENTVANRSLFMGGYESGKEAKESRLCLLLADIRSALGDPEGKMMQEDFVQHCKEVVEWLNKLDFADWKGGAIKNRGEYGFALYDLGGCIVEHYKTPLEALTAYLKGKE